MTGGPHECLWSSKDPRSSDALPSCSQPCAPQMGTQAIGHRSPTYTSIRKLSTMVFITKTARFALKAFQSSEWTPQTDWRCLAVLGLVLNLMAQGAFALNLGHMQINSKQGEPLKARVEVDSATPEELQGLRVRLFGQKDYEALNLNWENSLAKTTMKLVEGPNSRLFVEIDGQEPVAQAYVELFFEMRWNSGQVNRQMGLLLDAAPTTLALAPKDNADGGPSPIVVSTGDTASQLMEPYLDGNISMDQMLMALLRNNPRSFVNGNVNLLRSGSTLVVPSTTTAAAMKPLDARVQVQIQNQAFESYRKALVGKIKAAPMSDLKSAQQSASGKVHDPKGAKSRQRDQLTLNAPKAKGPSPQELEKLAQEKAAQEQAQKLLELQNNIKELQAISEQEKGFSFLKLWNSALSGVQAQWTQSKDWIYLHAPIVKTFYQWTLAPVVSGLVLAFLSLLWAWRMKHHRQNSISSGSSEPRDAGPSMGPGDWREKDEAHFIAPSFEDMKHETWGPSAPIHDNANANNNVKAQASSSVFDQSPLAQASPHTTAPDLEDDRVKLAEDLWEIGQHHTAYAIAQEVYQQSSGREFERAKLWLESHAI